MRKKLTFIGLIFSLALNAVLAYPVLNAWLNNPADRVGQLTRNIEVGASTAPFRFPAGLTVRDASPRGLSAVGQFEPYRLSIVVTSDHEGLVDYDVPPDKLNEHQDLCSGELRAIEGFE